MAFNKTVETQRGNSLYRTATLVLFLSFLLVIAGKAFAQSAGGQADSWQFGAFYGRALPHDVSNQDNIFTIWGLRLSAPMPTSASHGGYFDGTYTSGNGGAVSLQQVAGGVSLQIPVQSLELGTGIGLNTTRYTSDMVTGAKTVLGEYFTGSVLTKITPSVLARFDMTVSSQPGTILVFDLGLMYDF